MACRFFARLRLAAPTRLRRSLATSALVLALLPAAPSSADFYRWTDSEGVTHYAQDLERVPRHYRASAQIVRPHVAPAQGPLPVLEVERAPGPDEAGFEEPGLGEQGSAPLRTPQAVAPGNSAPVPLPPDADPREVEIAELERELDARREELKTMISQSSFDSSRITSDPHLRELAEIVPRLQAELDALRGEIAR